MSASRLFRDLGIDAGEVSGCKAPQQVALEHLNAIGDAHIVAFEADDAEKRRQALATAQRHVLALTRIIGVWYLDEAVAVLREGVK